jgi:hypothetical protein
VLNLGVLPPGYDGLRTICRGLFCFLAESQSQQCASSDVPHDVFSYDPREIKSGSVSIAERYGECVTASCANVGEHQDVRTRANFGRIPLGAAKRTWPPLFNWREECEVILTWTFPGKLPSYLLRSTGIDVTPVKGPKS